MARKKSETTKKQDYKTVASIFQKHRLEIPHGIEEYFNEDLKARREEEERQEQEVEAFLESKKCKDIMKAAEVLIEGETKKFQLPGCDMELTLCFFWDLESGDMGSNCCGIAILDFKTRNVLLTYIFEKGLCDYNVIEEFFGDESSHAVKEMKDSVKEMKSKISKFIKEEIESLVLPNTQIEVEERIWDDIGEIFNDKTPKYTNSTIELP